MLILSRREGESISIGENVTVKVIKSGRTVKVAIDAPRDVAVDRTELKERQASGTASALRPNSIDKAA